MKNGPFEDVFPIENGDICSIPMIVCQRVDIFIQSCDSPTSHLLPLLQLKTLCQKRRPLRGNTCRFGALCRPKKSTQVVFCGNLDRTWFLIVLADCFYSGWATHLKKYVKKNNKGFSKLAENLFLPQVSGMKNVPPKLAKTRKKKTHQTPRFVKMSWCFFWGEALGCPRKLVNG